MSAAQMEPGTATADTADATDREITATRVFDAPRALVFQAWTRPEHVRRWYGPRAMEMAACEADVRPGGGYRYVLRAADGREHAFSGVYREVEPPARLVYTWGWEAMPGHDALETIVFDEHDGGTLVTMRTVFPSVEDLEGWAASGGYEGMAETLERFAEVVAELAGA